MIESLAHVVREIFWRFIDIFGVGLIGKLGSWTAWVITLGKWDVDEESWTGICVGWCVVVFGIFCGVTYWRLRA